MSVIDLPTEAELQSVVHHFYAAVRQHPDLGPIFNGIIHDWPQHLDHITAFWVGVILGKPGFTGHPMVAHHHHRDLIRPEHFAMWLGLWQVSTEAKLPPAQAALLQGRAQAMAQHFQRVMYALG